MTLSGNCDRRERAEAARAARQARASAGAEKRPWLLPLIVGVSVAILAAVIVLNFVLGVRL